MTFRNAKTAYYKGYYAGKKASDARITWLMEQHFLQQQTNLLLHQSNLMLQQRVTMLEADRTLLEAQVRQLEEWSN